MVNRMETVAVETPYQKQKLVSIPINNQVLEYLETSNSSRPKVS